MVSAIGSIGSSMMQIWGMASSRTQPRPIDPVQPMQRQKPQGEGLFEDMDTDASGGLSQSEFDVLAQGISKVTGSTVDVQKTFGTYDANADGSFNGQELRKAMTGLGVEPPPPPRAPPPGRSASGQPLPGFSGTVTEAAIRPPVDIAIQIRPPSRSDQGSQAAGWKRSGSPGSISVGLSSPASQAPQTTQAVMGAMNGLAASRYGAYARLMETLTPRSTGQNPVQGFALQPGLDLLA